MNTRKKILAALTRRNKCSLPYLHSITGSTKITARISDLRRQGHTILNTTVWSKKDQQMHSTYQLIK